MARHGAPGAARRRTTGAVPTARFYGDPGVSASGVSNFYNGIAPNVSSIATHETEMGAPLAMIRVYGTGNQPPWGAADDVIAGGRIPWISWLEGSFTVADIAAGGHDDWIHGIADGFKQRAPQMIPWSFHHEPENDPSVGGASTFGGAQNLANAASYRAAQRRIKQTFRSDGVTNDIFVCCNYQTPSTFNTAASKRDWRIYYPDWKNQTGVGTADAPDPNDFWVHGDPNSVVDSIGLDFYHGWDLAAGAPMSKWTQVTATNVWAQRLEPKIGFLNQPLAIGEWATAAAQTGFTFDPNGDGSWTLTEYAADAGITYLTDQTDDWIDDYYTTLTAHGCWAFCYWDSRTAATNVVANNPLSIADPPKTRWHRIGLWGNKPQAKADPT